MIPFASITKTERALHEAQGERLHGVRHPEFAGALLGPQELDPVAEPELRGRLVREVDPVELLEQLAEPVLDAETERAVERGLERVGVDPRRSEERRGGKECR